MLLRCQITSHLRNFNHSAIKNYSKHWIQRCICCLVRTKNHSHITVRQRHWLCCCDRPIKKRIPKYDKTACQNDTNEGCEHRAGCTYLESRLDRRCAPSTSTPTGVCGRNSAIQACMYSNNYNIRSSPVDLQYFYSLSYTFGTCSM